ncbi:MAG TPA: hypothetical protein PKZ76_15975 [Xanthomonadaceae bacterium]|nr:hypothetical protein [Xanthomonadaceae bacterium]
MASDADMVMHVYDVPPDRAEEIRNSLRVVLFSSSERRTPIGHASVPIPGQLVVLAPATLHASIESTVRALGEQGTVAVEATPPGRVRLEAWLATPAGSEVDDPRLAAVLPALDAVRPTFGDVRFALVSRAFSLARDDGGRVSLMGGAFNGDASLRPAPDGVHASLSLQVWSGRGTRQFRSDVELPDGKPQIIALISDGGRIEEEASDLILILVAHRVDD